MKNRMTIISVCPVISIVVLEHVNALVAAIFVPPTACYAKLPRLPDDDKYLVVTRERR